MNSRKAPTKVVTEINLENGAEAYKVEVFLLWNYCGIHIYAHILGQLRALCIKYLLFFKKLCEIKKKTPLSPFS